MPPPRRSETGPSPLRVTYADVVEQHLDEAVRQAGLTAPNTQEQRPWASHLAAQVSVTQCDRWRSGRLALRSGPPVAVATRGPRSRPPSPAGPPPAPLQRQRLRLAEPKRQRDRPPGRVPCAVPPAGLLAPRADRVAGPLTDPGSVRVDLHDGCSQPRRRRGHDRAAATAARRPRGYVRYRGSPRGEPLSSAM